MFLCTLGWPRPALPRIKYLVFIFSCVFLCTVIVSWREKTYPWGSYCLSLVGENVCVYHVYANFLLVSPGIKTNYNSALLFWHLSARCKKLVLAHIVGSWKAEEKLSIIRWTEVTKIRNGWQKDEVWCLSTRRQGDNPMYLVHRWSNTWSSGIPCSSTCSPTHFNQWNLGKLAPCQPLIYSCLCQKDIMPPFESVNEEILKWLIIF